MLLGLVTVFIIEHYGKFSYLEDASTNTANQNNNISFTRNIDYSAKVAEIYLKTPFGTHITFDGGNFGVGNMYGAFKRYSNKIAYYFKATFKDIKYVFLFGVGYSIFILIAFNFKRRQYLAICLQ
ncbi:hypothetical protein [Aurantibacter sp.]|uniref:hypothetical protein n=1 Tax=Aurantibacter sp. TaxID=2807103 RepID=UPI0035C83535